MTNISRVSRAAGETGAPRVHAAYVAALSAAAYRALTNLIYQHSRIRLGPDKQSMVANRLRKRLRALELDSYDDYCRLLESSEGPNEIEHLIDLIATNHTGFYREPEHFTFLARHVLPEWASRLAETGAPLRVWSAAASSGEEAYTLALVLAEYFLGRPPLEWQVEATDISHSTLDYARQGIYPLDARHGLAPELLKRYFQRGVGERAGTCRVKAELRSRVRFQRVNLFQAEYPVPREQHVIFCRNVMIYFDEASRAILVQKLARHMARGGYLVIGHSESLLGIRHGLEPVRQSIFRKP